MIQRRLTHSKCFAVKKRIVSSPASAGEHGSWDLELWDPGGVIGAGGGGIRRSELVEVESEYRSWWRWNRSWWRWDESRWRSNRRIGVGGCGIRRSELVEVESEDRSWWRWNQKIGAGGGGIGAGGGGIGAGGGGIGAGGGGIGAGGGGIGDALISK
ncbi:unnamed protein product [Caenorhabditis nigoni]